MKQIMEKYEILMLRNKIGNTSEVAKLAGVSRNTVNKYWNAYQEQLTLLKQDNPDIDTRIIIEDIVSNPKYDTASRKPVKYNKEMDTLLDTILADEDKKTERLGKQHKQKLSVVQIHELIVAHGYDIGRSTISNKVKEKRNEKKETFIKQEYDYGERFEYDFGEVILFIDNKETKGHIAVLSAPASGFRWAYLYRNQKMEVFLDSHVRFFEMIQGSFKQGVYDNMRNVVSKFIGRNEKELNQELVKLSLYYGFDINVTNCFSGNEKGTVESSVRWIRNKVFALKYKFKSFEDAADHLEERLVEINASSKIEEEKPWLSAYLPKYETADIMVSHVDKYSFIQIDTNHYSVPEDLVGKKVVVKKYPKNIEVYYNKIKQCVHVRIYDKKKTCIDIKHYLDTFKRKPGALRNSLALKSEPELKHLFDNHFKAKPREFIEILFKNKDKSIEDIIDIVNDKHAATTISNVVTEKTDEQISIIQSYFVGGNTYVN